MTTHNTTQQTGLTAFHYTGLALLAAACAIASINPLEFPSYLLHQLGTLLMVIGLLSVTRKGWVSRTGFAATIIFLLLHVSAAHYLYSYVPYNEWLINLFGWDMNATFGWTRNMYDRLVHLMYGVLLYPLIADLLRRAFPQSRPSVIALLVIQFVMASSVFYEFIEWWIALGMSPEEAENYNGQQGDIWDAHADMALATLGSIISATLLWFKPATTKNTTQTTTKIH